jgi:hypothetical protein
MRRLGAVVVAAGCAYEVAAILGSRTPTISQLSWRLRDAHPVGAVALWGVMGVLAWHLFMDENPQK